MSILEVCRTGMLAGADRPIHWTSERYIVARKGDSLEQIAARIGDWARYHTGRPSEVPLRFAQKMAQDTILALNPNAISTELPPGTRVIVPDIRELTKVVSLSLQVKSPAARAAR